MLEYRSFEEIIDHPGLRIVLVKGMPSPWGQAAKTIFEIKGLEYVRRAMATGRSQRRHRRLERRGERTHRRLG